MVPKKSLRTGIGKIWYRKKVSEPVSEKFGTGKSTGIGIVNIWYRKKVSIPVSFKILGTVILWQVGRRKSPFGKKFQMYLLFSIFFGKLITLNPREVAEYLLEKALFSQSHRLLQEVARMHQFSVKISTNGWMMAGTNWWKTSQNDRKQIRNFAFG